MLPARFAALVLVTACAPSAPATRAPPAPRAETPAARTSAAPAPPPAAAAGPGFRGLVPGMTPDEARRAIEQLGFVVGEHTGRARPPHWLEFDTPEWHATLYLGDADRRVVEVLLQGKESSDRAAARRAFDAGSAGRGTPAHSTRVVGNDGTFVEEARTWSEGTLVLKIELHESIHGPEHRFVVFESWSAP